MSSIPKEVEFLSRFAEQLAKTVERSLAGPSPGIKNSLLATEKVKPNLPTTRLLAADDVTRGTNNKILRVIESNLLPNVERRPVDLSDARNKANYTIKIDKLGDFMANQRELTGDIFKVQDLEFYVTTKATRQSNGLVAFSFKVNSKNKPNFRHCRARLRFRLLNQESDKLDHLRSLNWVLEPNSACGFPVFIYDSDFIDPQKGFVKNDAIFMELEIEADEPVGLARKSWPNRDWTSKICLNFKV